MYLGDFAEDATVTFTFCTNAADGGRESFSASLEEADIVIFKGTTAMTLDASTITITTDTGSRTGVHTVSVDMSNDADFTTGSDYHAVLYASDETLDSQAPAGTLACWSCENRSVNVARISGSATAANNAEVVFDTDFATNYNATRNAWATNVQDTVGTGNLPVDVIAVSGDTTAANNLELDYDGTGYNKANSTIGTCTVNTDMRGTDSAATATALATAQTDLDTITGSDGVTLATTQGNYAPAKAGDNMGTVSAVTGGINTAAGTITTLDGLDTAQDSQHSTTQTAVGNLNDLSAAEVNTQVDAAIVDYHLDHLLAAAYDPTSKPGNASGLLNVLFEDDGGVPRYTANSLEQAPTGGSAPSAADIADAVWDEVASGHTTNGTYGKAFSGATAVYLVGIAGTINTLDALDTAQDSQHGTTQSAIATAQVDLDTLTGADGATLASSQPNYAPATAASLATAQSDLDTITGTDGVTLATTQGNYAPAVAGNQMDLVNAPNATAVTAIQSGLATASALTTVGGNVTAVKAVTDALTAAAAAKLATSAGTIVTGTVSTATTSPTTTVFAADDITEATADHFNGRIVIFTSGVLANQATDITDYELNTGEGKFTVTALTESPSNNDTFVIV